MPVEELPIDGFVVDLRLQCRESLDASHVHDLMDAMAEGVDLPPGVAFRDYPAGAVRLVEGYHRREAYRLSGKTTFPCEVKAGNEVAAVQAAAAANKSHGLKRTNEDKRKAVGVVLSLPDCVLWSNARIAKHVGVSLTFVAECRGRTGVEAPAAVVGTDGKTRKLPANRGKAQGKRLPWGNPLGPQSEAKTKDCDEPSGEDGEAEPPNDQESPPHSQPQVSTIYNEPQIVDERSKAHPSLPTPAGDTVATAEPGPAVVAHKELEEAWKKAKYGLADGMALLRNFARAVGPHDMPLNEWERTANAWLAKAGEQFSRRSRELSNAKAKKAKQPATEATA